jgi:hypothetical protein
MARPKRNYEIEIIGVKLTLIRGEDDDLIDLLHQTPKNLRAITVKSALRGQVLQPGMCNSVLALEIGEELDGFVL